MDNNTLWVALALVLVIEGIFPFASPASWRKMFTRLLQLNDGQIRLFALGSISCGLLLVLWLTP